ncbi:phage scaffolding protein [Enterococcus avium]|uniref:phage scaffolding protein n=1 Tax=Enterococcus avium TaxID=33945 RepID=UPI003D6A2CCD
MKKEDLLELGIDEETAKSVMALHGKTVTSLNTQLSTVQSERDNANQQLEANQTELNSLKESAKGNEELTQQLADLQGKFNTIKSESETKLSEQQKDFAIKLALKEANALDESIVLGLLDRDTIKVTDNGLQGLDEQLNGLKESKSFLFQEPIDPNTKEKPQIVTEGNPAGSTEISYDLSKMSYKEVAKLKNEQPEIFKQLIQ